MNRITQHLIVLATLFVVGMACSPQMQASPALTPTSTRPSPTQVSTTGTPTDVPSPTCVPTHRPTGLPTTTNPLTGLRVGDPSVLDRSPLVVKVSNESPEVRPQSGLSFADHVWEHQMEGWAQTRYTAIFYSRAPERVGSVRSVRLIDTEHLLPMYDGLLVFSGASSGMWEIITNAPWVERTFRENTAYAIRDQNIPRIGTDYYHSLFATPEAVWREATGRGVNQRPNLGYIAFDTAIPAGGVPTSEVSIDYPGLGPKHTWRYDPASGRWLSSTEDQRMRVPDTPDVDFLTGEQLAYDNVVIIHAEHYLADFIEDERNQLLSVGVHLIGEGRAVLLRDGQRFECKWQRDSISSMIQLVDADGKPIPLKPGTVWYNLASIHQYPPEIMFTP